MPHRSGAWLDERGREPGPLWTGQRGRLTHSGITQIVLTAGRMARNTALAADHQALDFGDALEDRGYYRVRHSSQVATGWGRAVSAPGQHGSVIGVVAHDMAAMIGAKAPSRGRR